ncbi:MAG: DUF924 domain-containing protein [Kangiellaceae bacterium]|nr:DUF924 domain-containing protein [Kangiellaceae bacterium]
MNYKEIIKFWFEDIDRKLWFSKSNDFDRLLEKKFHSTYHAAKSNELFDWRQNAQGRLAEIILLDQFSRNLFRDSPLAFTTDPLSLCLAQEAVLLQLDEDLPLIQRAFLYMPYMHSESLIIHHEAIKLFSIEGLEENLHFEIRHKKIIEQFGRYPHRNQLLGRESTPEEIDFLRQPRSSF